MKTRMFLLLASLALAGCNTVQTYVDRSGPPVPQVTGKDAGGVILVAQTFADLYVQRSSELEDATYLTDIPLLGLAVGSAAALYYGAHTDLIAGLGIGAGTVAVVDSMMAPRSRAQVYRNGAAAMNCVVEKGQALNSPARLHNLQVEIARFTNGPIKRATELLDQRPEDDFTVVGDQEVRLKDARAALLSALQAAKRARDTALAEAETGANGGAILGAAVRAIDLQVRNALKSQPLSFSSALNTIQGAAQALGDKVASVQQTQTTLDGLRRRVSQPSTQESPTKEIEDHIAALEATTKQLVQETQILLDSLPKFTKAAQDAALCRIETTPIG